MHVQNRTIAEAIRQAANHLNLPLLTLEDMIEDGKDMRARNVKLDILLLMRSLEDAAKEFEK